MTGLLPSQVLPLFTTVASQGPVRSLPPGLLLVTWEMPVFGDYPTEGWKFWAFMAFVGIIGLFGLVLMLVVSGHMNA